MYDSVGDSAGAARSLSAYYALNKRLREDDAYLQLFRYQNEVLQAKENERIAERNGLHRLYMTSGIAVAVILLTVVHFHVRKRNERIKNKEYLLTIRQLQNEKEERDIRLKRETLEIKRMQQYQMSRLIKEIVDKLGKLELPEGKEKIGKLCDDLMALSENELWKEVSNYIPEFGSGFMDRLCKDFPDLTVNERRLCALLNHNLSTKEISEITRQSTHSINIARGRLRNKLKLTGSSMTLQEFLSKYNAG